MLAVFQSAEPTAQFFYIKATSNDKYKQSVSVLHLHHSLLLCAGHNLIINKKETYTPETNNERVKNVKGC